MAFHEVRFPANLSFGSTGGPERRTEIVALANGFEERNSPWAHSRRRYDAGLGMRSLEDVESLIAFFEARRGQLNGFRWKDWADYRSGGVLNEPEFDNQVIGVGDGSKTTFQLLKTYRSGEQSYTRPIKKPVLGTVSAGLQGDAQIEGIHFTVDTSTGTLIFSVAPEPDATVTAGYEFDVPVRFDTESIQVSVASFKAGEIPNVPVIEVRL
ncbi:MAG: phage distal tail protein, Rcc01695 family [Boseongicola sp.]